MIAHVPLLARGPSIVPIFGTRRLDGVKENLGAAEEYLYDTLGLVKLQSKAHSLPRAKA